MNNTTSLNILEKINVLERDLQKLKIETYFGLPEKIRKFVYPEKSLLESIRSLRNSIWQQRYAKKIQNFS